MIMVWRTRLLLGLALIGCSIAAGAAASIAGTVADPSGAMMPQVVVAVRNIETSAILKALTDTDGLYTFSALPSGRYELRIEQPLFNPYRQTGLEVTTDQALRVNVELTLMQQVAAVTVSEAAPLMETTNTQIGAVMGSAKMTDIPANGRSFTDLLALQPGVIPASSQQPNAVVMSGCTSAPPSGDLNPGNLSVSGQRETANGFTVNGSAGAGRLQHGRGHCAQPGFHPGASRAYRQLRRRVRQL